MEQEIQNHTDAIGHGEVDALTDSPVYDDEHSFCNCESNECITPYKSDKLNTETLRTAGSDSPDGESSAHAGNNEEPRNQLQRLKNDFLKAGNNPYIRREHTCRINLYRQKDDTEPIDSFEANTSHGFSARAILLLGASLLGICLLTRLLGKKD